MRTLGERGFWSYYRPDQDTAWEVKTPTKVREAPGRPVGSYMELAKRVAELQYHNPDLVLMFRGQANDYHNIQHRTTLKPALFRSLPGTKAPPDLAVIRERYVRLRSASDFLLEEFRSTGVRGVQTFERYHLLRWAILQHYEVCPTPLLDVTHSLRIAASFASLRPTDNAYVMVLGVPNLSGAITACAEVGLQMVRLSSVCPPSAVRPHIQEGYLLAEYPDMMDHDQKSLYEHYEIDFGLRLVAKFSFDPAEFWTDDVFPKVSEAALYPPSPTDPVREVTDRILSKLSGE